MAASLDTLHAAAAARASPAWRQLCRPSIELFSALVLLGWSALLFGTPLFGRGTSYQAMAALADQATWGALLTTVALAQIGAIVTRHPALRIIGCSGACAAWAFVAVMLSQVHGVRTGGVTYGLISLFLLWRNLRTDS